MNRMESNVVCYDESDLTSAQVTAIETLTSSVWPDKTRSLDQRIRDTLRKISIADKLEQRRRLVVVEDSRVVAHALVFKRTVYFLDDSGGGTGSQNVLALAGVCTDRECRGRGLGVEIVRAAFKFLDNAAPVSLFQTGVPGFYEKLGGRIAVNQFVNRRDARSPEKNPWWDDAVMIYPKGFPWSESIVDLNGAGY